MRDELGYVTPAYRVVIVTLDAHAAGPAARVLPALARDFPGLEISVHAAARWAEEPARAEAARAAIDGADLVITSLLFLEEHVQAVLPNLEAARDRADAVIGMVSDAAIVRMTRMGELDMGAPPSGLGKLMKRLRGSSKPGKASGEKQMAMLRRLPKILRFIPGKAQDLRAWFLTMQYWLGGSDDNIEQMIRFLLSRYAGRAEWRGAEAALPVSYPEVGLYHPDTHITDDPEGLPRGAEGAPVVGLLMMRSYILSGDTAHYDAVIRRLEAEGARVLPAFAGGARRASGH